MIYQKVHKSNQIKCGLGGAVSTEKFSLQAAGDEAAGQSPNPTRVVGDCRAGGGVVLATDEALVGGGECREVTTAVLGRRIKVTSSSIRASSMARVRGILATAWKTSGAWSPGTRLDSTTGLD